MIRDLLISHFFGNSYMADAYFAAMTIPNAIVLFMLTGMKDSFLPSYYKYEKKGEGFTHLTNIVKGTFLFSSVVALMGSFLSPFFIPWLYPDFSQYADGHKIAVWTAILYFLSVSFVGVNAVYEGYFDAQKKFSFSTFSQTIVVFMTIFFTIAFHGTWGIFSVPIGYVVGTICSLIIKITYLKPTRFLNWSQKTNWAEVQNFYRVFIPVGLTIAVGQINLTVNSLFASRLGEGVVSSLNYAFRLVNIPQAIFGVTIATMIFPMLAEAKSTGNTSLFRTGMEKGLSTMFLFLAPTVFGMVFLMDELVKIVYERGAFDSEATAMTSEYAVLYVGSVLFYSIQAVVAKGFYTLEKGHYMMRIGLLSVVVNIIFNAVFSAWLGPKGLALSSSLVGAVYSTLTFTTLYRMVGGFSLRNLGREYVKIIISAVVMLLTLHTFQPYAHSLSTWVYVLVMMVVGAIVYFVMLYVLRTSSFLQLIRKGG